MGAPLPSRGEVEDFLFRETAMLDNWQLMDWVALFTEDGEYLVPATDMPDGEPNSSLFLIYDDHHRLTERAKRLMKKTAHAEFPHSRLRRIIGNVMVERSDAADFAVTCNFAVFRNRMKQSDIFSGHSHYEMIASADAMRIRKKRAVLDSDDLRAQGKLSIIL
ncbi:MAG: aromatic-ring-hydroxylating dioxygenase subunit beta [Alphaproteobacteria bacterium]